MVTDRNRRTNRPKQKRVLEVAGRERRGKAWIDHRTPFGAPGPLVEERHFLCARPDLDLPIQRNFDVGVREGGQRAEMG